MSEEEATRPADPSRDGRGWRTVGTLILSAVALVGAVLSWGNLYRAARTAVGNGSPTLLGVNLYGAAFPFLLDTLILGCSLMYVGGVKAQRPAAGWRVLAHTAIAATVAFNAAAGGTIGDAPWHIVAPAVWALIVELYARDALREMREVRHDVEADRIPLRLWLSAPAESARTSWRMARTGERSAALARTSSDACAAARDALVRTLPGASTAAIRRQVTRRLWAGTILPEDVFAACGWTDVEGGQRPSLEPDDVLRASLRRIVGPASQRPSSVSESDVRASVGRPSPRVAGQRPNGRRAQKPQVGGGVPSELTPNEVAVWSAMLGRGEMRRSAIFAASGLSDRGAKDALDRLVRRTRVALVSRGVYRSVDPTGLDVPGDVEADAESSTEAAQ